MNSDPAVPSTRTVWLAWIAVLGLAAALRTYELGQVSAWYDEAATWKTITLPWSEMGDSLRRNVHPPVYALTVRLWSVVFGDSPEALRLFSVVCGLLTLPVISKLSCEFNSPSDLAAVRSCPTQIPSLATWAYALSPIAIEQSQQARMYALAILWAAMLGWGLIRVMKRPADWAGWIAVTVCGNLLPLTHYYGLLNSAVVAFVLGTLSLASPRQRLLACSRQWAVACGVTIACWVNWLPVFLDQHSRVQAGYWIPEFSFSELTIFVAEWSSSSQVRNWGLRCCQWIAALTVLMGVASVATRSPLRLAHGAMAFGPPVISILYSLWTRNLLQGRYWGMAHLYFVVSVALWISSIRSQRVRIATSVILLVWMTVWTIQGLQDRAELVRRSGLRECSVTLRTERGAEEPVFVASPFYGPSIQRYQTYRNGVYILKPAQPLTHFQGQAIFRPEEILALSEADLSQTNRFWIVADELLSMTIQNPNFIVIPAGWQRISTKHFNEANRLPTRLELWEYVRVSTRSVTD
jgi:hypothetical protein